MTVQSEVANALHRVQPYLDNAFPRNIIAVCEALDIEVKETKDFPQNVSGLIYKKQCKEQTKEKRDKYCILVNAEQSAGRKTFTIAHELGHYLMHKAKLDTDNEIISGAKGIDIDSQACIARTDITADSSAEYRKLETEANRFAAEVLMPRDIFLNKCMSLDSIDDVASYFGVSISAATIRADRLGGLYFL